MKKLVLTLGLASLFMVACNNTPKQPEQAAEPVQEEKTEVVEEKHDCPMHALKEEYAKWDEMTDEAKAELNKKAAEVFTTMDAEMEAKKAELEKKCAEMKAKWDNFANLTVDEQKDLIMQRLGGCDHGDKPCCKHEGEQPAAE